LVEVENFLPEIRTISVIWLLVWNMAFIFPYIEKNHANWLSYFQRGWNHQPVINPHSSA
jgi:hypothetical protein